MGLLEIVTAIIVFLSTLAIFAHFYVTFRDQRYWKKKKVKYYGNVLLQNIESSLRNRHAMVNVQKIYDEMKKDGEKMIAFTDFGLKALLIRDVDILKKILIKDYEYFMDHRSMGEEFKDTDPHLWKMLFSMEGQEWKNSRAKLSPTFTTGKIKRVFAVFQRSSQKMIDFIHKKMNAKNQIDLEVCEVAGKFTLDTIAEAAFGMDSRSFEGKGESVFEKMAAKLTFKFDVKTILKVMCMVILPKVAKMLNIRILDEKADNFFSDLLLQSIQEREKNGFKRSDFLQILLEAKEGRTTVEVKELEQFERDAVISDENIDKQDSMGFDNDFIISQMLLFLSAGFDTTQSFLSMLLYTLAIHSEVQEKLYEEVSEASEDFAYDKIMKMQYLDQVINETLRLYPPAVVTDRNCLKNYEDAEVNFEIEKGISVMIPIAAIHRDPEYYEDPDSFKPERFSPEEKRKRLPYTFLPFGHGPRNCIGMRFALAEIKLAISYLVKNFKFEPCAKTEIPVQIGSSNMLKPKNGMWLKTTVRS